MRLEDVTALELLDAAIERLHRSGWQQDSLGLSQGPNCAAGLLSFAISDLTGRQVDQGRFRPYLQAFAQVERVIESPQGLVWWNDEEHRSAEDIALAFKRARYALEAERET